MSNSNYHELQEKDSKVYTNSVILNSIIQTEDDIPIAIPVTDNLSNNICKICFNDTEINNFINLTCNHKLCKDCFQEWNKTCPWCREEIQNDLKINNLNKVNKVNNINNSDTCTESTCKVCINVIAILSGIFIIVIMYIQQNNN